MTNLLQDSAAWLGGRLQAAAGRTVRIQQGTQKISEIVGWVSEGFTNVVDESGFLTRVPSYDWNFVTAELVDDNGNSVVFRSGAEVIEAIGNLEYTYEALPEGSLPASDELDKSSGGKLTILRTKKVE